MSQLVDDAKRLRSLVCTKYPNAVPRDVPDTPDEVILTLDKIINSEQLDPRMRFGYVVHQAKTLGALTYAQAVTFIG